MPHRLSITLSDAPTAQPTKSLLKVDRTVSDVRRGQIVAIETSDTELVLCLAAEGSTKALIQKMKQISDAQPHLTLTSTRLNTLGLGNFGAKAVRAHMGKALRPDLIEGLVNPLADLSKNDLFDVNFEETDDIGGDNAAIGLTKLARLLPAAIVVKCHKPENDYQNWLEENFLLSVTTEDIFGYEELAARSLNAVSDARVPLVDAPETKIVAFRPNDGGIEHLAVIIGQPDPQNPVLIRIHSECFTGDLVGSLRCDCGDQLRGAIQSISKEGSGILLYLAQEGRGIGLVNKLRAYTLQDRGMDTFDANELLGYDADERVYLPAARILEALGIDEVRLMTNNPEKIKVLEDCGVKVSERVAHAFPSNQHNEYYIKAKADKGGHML